jgi:phosphate transport system protein
MPAAKPHLEIHLQQDINHLRRQVSELGERAGRAIERSIRALTEANLLDAQAVILRDRFLDRMERDGERIGLEMLVRHQPVGRTLRFVHASLRILGELERIGDYAASIARQVLRVEGLDPKPFSPSFVEQSRLACDMLDRAMRAYRTEDSALARQSIPLEEAGDQLRDRVRDELLARQRAGTINVPRLTALLTVSRRLERVTDQARSICEEVVFLCSGESVRHPHADAIRVLFVDDAQASLGHLAEAVARRHGDERFAFESAGLRPLPPDPRTRAFLAKRGVEVADLVSRSLGQVPPLEEQDLIIALTPSARQVFAMSAGGALCIDWPMEDPSAVEDPRESEAAFERAWTFLEERLRPLIDAVNRE